MKKVLLDSIVCNDVPMVLSKKPVINGLCYVCDFCTHKKLGGCLVKHKQLARFIVDGRALRPDDIFGQDFFESCGKFKLNSSLNPINPDLIKVVVEMSMFSNAVEEWKQEVEASSKGYDIRDEKREREEITNIQDISKRMCDD